MNGKLDIGLKLFIMEERGPFFKTGVTAAVLITRGQIKREQFIR